ncbi:MAG: NAD(P)H-hydrate dehydratase [Hyphomicrobiales bacterium]|nr:NAD(P)H-hydrate dehydratase [Hyphomicrobiales bacterium]
MNLNTTNDGLELLTPAQMYAADAAAISSGTPGIDLMENAGYAVFRQIVMRWSKRPVTVLCGPGNNGGDGFVVARLLLEDGWPVTLAVIGDVARLKGDAALAANRWTGPTEPVTPAAIDGARLIVDALFGAGLARDIEPPLSDVFCLVARSGMPVVAIDIPSGIDGETGQARGTAIRADLTVTFFRRKPGHLLLPGRSHCGETICEDIGIARSALPADEQYIYANDPVLWRRHFQPPAAEAHKYDHGHAVVVSGGAYTSGAARLAAQAALRAGAGLVTVASPRQAMPVNAAQLNAVMLSEADDAPALSRLLSDHRKTAACIGPGCSVSGQTRAKVRAVLGSGTAAVLDADALSSFAPDPDALFTAIADAPNRPVVLTPHEGEFARLFKGLDLPTDSKCERALAAARISGAVVVLKGADTVIAEPGGRIIINENAPARLATAGAGDVLSGIVLANLARHIPAFEAAAAAVWLHGAAAAAGADGLTADDLPDLLAAAMASLYK